MTFSDGSKNNYTRGPSQLWTPLYTQLTLRIYAGTNGLGDGAKLTLSRAQETLGTPLTASYLNLRDACS